MASVSGAHHHSGAAAKSSVHAASASAAFHKVSQLGTSSLAARGGHDTVAGHASHGHSEGAHGKHAGLDKAAGLGHEHLAKAGGDSKSGTQKAVATHEVKNGNVTLHLPDGSSMTLLNVTHVDSSFFH